MSRPIVVLTERPLNNFGSVRVSEEMGDRANHPIDGEPSPHRGIDLVPSGDLSVFATHGGTVTESGYQINVKGKGWGNYITIRSSDGFSTRYAHLKEKSSFAVGKPVNAGDQIGVAGATGGVSGLHLHFEILDQSGKQINPRQSLAEAFPEFTAIVNAGDLRWRLDGDKHKNRMIGNEKPNYMDGLAGSDTYEFGFGDTVTDLDGDGMLKFNGNVLQGVMKPKGEAGDRWEGDNCDLVRQGSDLVLVASGADALNPDAPRAVIEDFPFERDQAFGIVLGKKVVGIGDVITKSDRDTFGAPLFHIKNNEGGLDKRGRFFTPALIGDGGVGTTSYGIGGFNANGDRISFSPLFSATIELDETGHTKIQQTIQIQHGGSTAASLDGKVALTYAVMEYRYEAAIFVGAKSSAHLAVIDDKGSVISNKAIDQFESNKLSDFGGSLGTQYYPYLTSFNDAGGVNVVFHKNANQIVAGSCSLDGKLIDSFAPITVSEIPQFLTSSRNAVIPGNVDLPTGHKVSPLGSLGDRVGFRVRLPKYEALSVDEIPQSISVNRGEDVEIDATSALVTLLPDSFGQEEGAIKIKPKAGAKLFIRGVTAENVAEVLDLSEFGLTKKELADRVTQVESDEYSMMDLLRGEYNPEDIARRDVPLNQMMKDRFEGEKVDEEELQRRDEGSGEYGDDYYEDDGEHIEAEPFEDNPQIYSVLNLPNGQQLIFPEIPSQNLSLAFNPNVPEIGAPNNQGGMNQVGLGFLIGGVVVAVAAVAIGTYKLATDTEFRQGAIDRARRFGSAINPMNWFGERNNGAVPETAIELQQITTGEDNIEAASDVGGPLHEPQMVGQIFDNPVFEEHQPRPATPPLQIRESRRLVPETKTKQVGNQQYS